MIAAITPPTEFGLIGWILGVLAIGAFAAITAVWRQIVIPERKHWMQKMDEQDKRDAEHQSRIETLMAANTEQRIAAAEQQGVEREKMRTVLDGMSHVITKVDTSLSGLVDEIKRGICQADKHKSHDGCGGG